MGHPCFIMKMPKSFGFKFLLSLLACIKLVVTVFLNNLARFKPRQQQSNTPHDNQEEPTHYVLLSDGLCPSPIPVAVHILTALIKKKLPVITYSSFLESIGNCEDDGLENMCPVCLDCIKGEDEIRELCNCCHVFHRNCLDSWVDEGQITCPTCRSMLLSTRSSMTIFIPVLQRDRTQVVEERG